jgi:hypothetical protein
MRGWIAAGAVAGALLPVMAGAQTRPGFEIGPELYYHAYREPNLIVQKGAFGGLNGSYTFKGGQAFATLNLIGAVGRVDYHSSGTGRIGGIWNYMGDLRALGGYDIPLSAGVTVSPFAGVGYRVLFDQAGGKVTSTGAAAYDRLSRYLYVPVGFGLTIDGGAWTYKPSAEYDIFIRGTQTSYLSQVGFSGDASNRQRNGYGVRASFLAETASPWGRLSVGPFARYWNIRRSVVTNLTRGGTLFDITEPANNTVEAGLMVKLGF